MNQRKAIPTYGTWNSARFRVDLCVSSQSVSALPPNGVRGHREGEDDNARAVEEGERDAGERRGPWSFQRLLKLGNLLFWGGIVRSGMRAHPII